MARTSSIREGFAVFAITTLAGVPLYLFATQGCGVRFNLTPSAPVGIYHRSERGGYLGFCPTGDASKLSIDRGYRSRSWFACPDGHTELIKRVATQPGDMVTFSADGIAVNGRLLPATAPQSKDRAGRPMPVYPFGVYLATGKQIWVVSQHAYGFDSRYYGPIEGGERLSFLGGW